MLIYQWSGEGRGFMSGVREYLELAEDEEDFKGDCETEAEAIEVKTAPGFTFDRKYDTDTETDFCTLPMARTLAVL